MITVASSLLFAPPSEGAQFQPQNSADPTPNFFSLLLTLFPPGTAPTQTASVQPQDASLGSSESATVPLPTLEPSLLAREETSEEDLPAPSEELDSSDQALLLSFLSSLLWMNTPPPAAGVEPTAPAQNREEDGAGSAIVPTSGLSTLTFLSEDGDVAKKPSEQDEGVLASHLVSRPSLLSVTADEAGRSRESEAALRVYEAFDKTAESPGGSAAGVKIGEGQFGKTMPFLPSAPAQIDAVASKTAIPADSPQKDLVSDPVLLLSGAEAQPSLLAPTLPKETASIGREKQKSGLALLHPEEIETMPSPKGPKQVESLLGALLAQEEDKKIEPILSRTVTGVEQASNSTLGYAPTLTAEVQLSVQSSHGDIENWQAVINQVSDGIVAKVQDNSREAHLQLSPPELGRLDIQIIVEGERVQAHIIAESKDVGTLIQSHLPELKQALQNHRLDLDTIRVDVQTNGENLNSSSQQFRQEARSSGQGRFTGGSSVDDAEEDKARPLAPLQTQGRISVWA